MDDGGDDVDDDDDDSDEVQVVRPRRLVAQARACAKASSA